MRQDLLALTTDDLITLSNRGVVKRSQQELQSGQLTYELNEDESGNIFVHWSDKVECKLPGDRVLKDGICTCPATSLCRHLIRSVLVYQETHLQQANSSRSVSAQENSTETASETEASEEKTSSSSPQSASALWNPGDIQDETLAQFFKKATLNKIRQQFDEGQVISLTRSSKPIAHIHTLSCTIRFLVAKDIRYTHCDCAEPAPCSHVPLAVWAFRLLDTAQSSGVVSTRQTAYPTPTDLLDDLENRLFQLTETGIAGASQAWRAQICRLEVRCREHNLIWLAEILAELVQEYDRYTQHDARFSPQHVVELIGELCIRSDAIRSNTDAVPQLFIRGSQADRTLEIGSARLVGLGCAVQLKHRSTELTAYCQDVDSGSIVALCRNFPDPPEESEPAKDFYQLAQTSIVKGVSLAQIGTGQLLIKGGKRTPSYQFIPGRAPVSFNPQAFQWESLRSSILIEDFAELSDRLSTQPPASLRPRCLSENLFVCRVALVEAATFNPIDQTVQAILRDCQGNPITLIHPYTSRGQAGTESLLAALTQSPEAIPFVAGQIQPTRQGLVLAPISLILQQSNNRILLQPWIAPPSPLPPSSIHPSTHPPIHPSTHPLPYLHDLTTALTDLLTLGLHRSDPRTLRHWQDLEQQGAALGFIRLLKPIHQLAAALAEKANTLRWNGRSASEAILAIALLLKLAQEQG